MAKIIAIVGMPGSGKTLVREAFEKKGFAVLRFGDETDWGLKRLGRPLTERNERWYREKLRKELGMAAYAIKIEPRIEQAIKKGNKTIVLDGLYSWAEYKYLKKHFPNLVLVCVWAPAKIRYQRLGERKIRPLTFKEAQSRDFAEIEKTDKGGPIAMADFMIENTGTKAELKKKVYEVLDKIRGDDA